MCVCVWSARAHGLPGVVLLSLRCSSATPGGSVDLVQVPGALEDEMNEPAGSFREEESSAAALQTERRPSVRAPGSQWCPTCPCRVGDPVYSLVLEAQLL